MSDAKEDVKAIVTPTKLVYQFNAIGSHAEFLASISEGKLIGERCGTCQKVYCPPRGSCPQCGVEMSEKIELGDKGSVTTFCVVRVPSENIELKLPYCAANILLDGTDMPIMALIQECEVEDVRIGMRVEAVWAPKEDWGPTMENIRHFRPIDEPDVSIESMGEWY
jgi:hypothetical protein